MRYLLLLSALAGCRAPVGGPHDEPFNFDAVTTQYALGTEATLQERWRGPLQTLWNVGERGEFKGVDGVTLRYVIHRVQGAKGAVVLVPGRTEAMMKFSEVIDDLMKAGYSTYALDIRGQGASDRMLPNRDKGYVVAFEDYVTDMHTFITTVVNQDEKTNVFVLAHSLGGAITTMLVDRYPNDVRAISLSAPMLEINTGAFPAPVAFSLGSTACNASDGTAYAIGSGDYNPEADFEKNSVTHSKARWQWKRGQLDDNPDIRLGGITWRWLCESLTASSAVQQSGKFSPVPTLLMQAEQDTIVKLEGQASYCADAPHCQLVLMKGAKHEILQETDDIRNKAMSMTLKFFAAKAQP